MSTGPLADRGDGRIAGRKAWITNGTRRRIEAHVGERLTPVELRAAEAERVDQLDHPLLRARRGTRPTVMTPAGRRWRISATVSGTTWRGLPGAKMKPSASAPRATARSASSSLVMPQIFTHIGAEGTGLPPPNLRTFSAHARGRRRRAPGRGAAASVPRSWRLAVRDWFPSSCCSWSTSLLHELAADLSPGAHVQPQLGFDEWLFGGTAPTVRLQGCAVATRGRSLVRLRSPGSCTSVTSW